MTRSALQLDFRRPAVSGGRWIGWGALLVAVMGVVAVSEAYGEAAQIHALAQSRHDQLEARSQQRNPGRDRLRNAEMADAQTQADMRQANAVIDRLVVPWDGLFDAIEGADAQGLGLLALTPNARDRTLQLVGEARTMDELLAYVERMAMQSGLRQVHLQSYSVAARDGVPVVSFTLAATWQQP